jgi:hypothetical protein
MSITRLTQWLSLSFFSAAVLGCSTTKPSIDAIDYGTPQMAAQILIGDPQIYSRASLINDRRADIDYLQQLLDNSAVDKAGKSVVAFSAQIIRDLKTVEAVSANFGLDLSKTVPGQSSIQDLNQQIAVARLKSQLAVLEKQIEGIQAAELPKVTVPAPDVSQTVNPPATTNPMPPDVSGLQASIKNIQAHLKDLSTVSSVTATTPSAYAALADPRDDFEDRQAYRRDIRAALAAAELDDVHDRGGNALYRLQFQVTTLPPNGETKKWGAAKLQVLPPPLRWDEIEAKYYNWLAYMTNNLSVGSPNVSVSPSASAKKHNYGYDHYLVQLGGRGYFNIIDLFSPDSESSQYFCFTHSSATESQLRWVDAIDNLGNSPGFVSTTNISYTKIGTYAIPIDTFDNLFLNPATQCSAFPANGSTTFLDPSRWLPADKVRFILSTIGAFDSANRLSRGFDKGAYSPGATQFGRETTEDAHLRTKLVPPAFCEALVKRQSFERGCGWILDSRTLAVAAGGDAESDDYAIKTYSVSPTEVAQRLGVTTEATQSLQTALSVAAQLSAVAKASTDVGRVNQADARAEALSRQPLVVGFSGFDGEPAKGYFGWLFGPRFSIDESVNLQLRQLVRSYGVSADISVPGWWSSIRLESRTAWVGNWSSSPEQVIVSKDAELSTRIVYLPSGDAAYDALTDFIAAKTWGQQNSRIFVSYVSPDVVPSCAQTITFQIGGTSIWRASNIYLGGAKAKTISVLPAMNGVLATFAMSEVIGSHVTADRAVQSVPLVVSAEQGSADPLEVTVVGTKGSDGDSACAASVSAATNSGFVSSTVLDFWPREICAGAKGLAVTVDGLNFPDGVEAYSTKFEVEQIKEVKSRQIFAEMKLKTGNTLEVHETVPVFFFSPAVSEDKRKVSSINRIGVAVSDCSAKALGQATPPDAPGDVKASSVGGRINVSFAAPKDGGSPIIGYTATAINVDASKGAKALVAKIDSKQTTGAISGCVPGDSYTVVVVATNKIGDGVGGKAGGPVICVGSSEKIAAPDAPGDIKASSVGGKINVSFTAPRDGGSPITGYVATATNVNAAKGAKAVVEKIDPKQTSGAISGCTAGDSYAIAVVATNKIGDSAVAKAGGPVTCLGSSEKATPPEAPSDIKASSVGGKINVSFTAPKDGGSPITGYVATATNVNAAKGANALVEKIDAKQTSGAISGCTAGDSYDITVLANNRVGTGSSGKSTLPAKCVK